jgi:MFS transporter, DHA2 family, multidrug resistance protein
METNTSQTGREEKVGAGRWWALGALVLSGLVIGLDTTILVTALPTIAGRLGASTSQLQWISAAYTLAWAGLLLPAGVLGDRLGRRRLLLFGLVLFGVASLAGSRMTSAGGLIAMRAVMGAGAAIIVPLTLSILPSMFSEEERPRAISLTAVGTFLGLPLGPLVAGWLLGHYDWGTIFLINAPVVVLAVLGVGLLVPESRDPEAPPLDWLGAVLAVVGITSLVYGIIEGPGKGWTDAGVLCGLTGGVLVLVAFVAWETRTRSPLVDLRLFLNPRFTWSTVAFVVVGFALTGVLFVVTPYLQIVQGADAQSTGIRLLPMIAGVMAGGIVSDRLAARLGTRVPVAAGLLVTAAGMVLLSRAGAETGYGLVGSALAVMGLGMGMALPTALDAILGALPPAQAGAGNGLTRSLQQVAASLGVAILGSILNSVYQTSLSVHLAGLPAQVREAAQSNVAGAAAAARHLPGPLALPLLRAAHDAYASGMAGVLLVSAGMMVAAAVLVGLFLSGRADPDSAGKTRSDGVSLEEHIG